MDKKIRKATILIFFGFIFCFSILNIFTEDKKFSENENRYLASMPKVSIDSILNKNFDEKFETYFTDQFIFRDEWISAKSMYQRMTMNIVNNGVYYAKDKNLIAQHTLYNDKLINRSIDYINKFANKHDNVYFMLVPGASAINRSLLPYFSYDFDQKDLIDNIYNKLDTNNIDVYSYIKDSEEAYFKMDHHWNEKGAYLGYQAICDYVLKKNPNEFSYELVNDNFKGTLYSKAQTFWYEGENLFKINPTNNIEVKVEYENNEVYEDTLYYEDALSTKDKYTYYLKGNNAIVNIKTSVDTGKKAVILKDSFAHILIPYLASEYEEIVVLDLRFYRNGVDEVITSDSDIYFIYSLENFIGDSNFVFLG